MGTVHQELFFIHYYSSKYRISKCFDATKTFGGGWRLQAANSPFLHSCPSVPREFHPSSSRVERGKMAQMSLGLQNKSFKSCHQPPAQGCGNMHSFLTPYSNLPQTPICWKHSLTCPLPCQQYPEKQKCRVPDKQNRGFTFSSSLSAPDP